MANDRVWVIVYCTTTGRTLLAKRSRHVNNSNLYGFFGGTVDEGEALDAAARRELIEEGGIHGDLKSLGSLKSGDRTHHYFIHTMADEQDPVLNNEHSKFRWTKSPKKFDLHDPVKFFFNSHFPKRLDDFRKKGIIARIAHYLGL